MPSGNDRRPLHEISDSYFDTFVCIFVPYIINVISRPKTYADPPFSIPESSDDVDKPGR